MIFPESQRNGQLETDREVVSRELYELRGQKSRSLRPSTLAAMVSGRLRCRDLKILSIFQS